MVEVTVVIPNYNGEKFLKTCLDSLRTQSYGEFSIIIVDNGSKDNSLKILEDYHDIQIIKLSENTGFCGAVNIGIKASCTPLIILLNNDVEVHQEFVKEMVKAMETSNKIFSCSAKLIQFNNRNLMDDAGNFYNALGWAFARGKGKHIDMYNEECEIFASCGGAAIYRASIFKEIGYFDEKHFAYLEDIDIGYRAKINGFHNRYAPKAIVYHIGSGTSGSKYNEFKVKHSSRNNIYMIYKNMPLFQLILNLPFLIIGFIIKILFFQRKGFGSIYIKGIVDGFKLCDKKNKVEFKVKNIGEYVKIQFELWVNIIKRI